MGDKKKGKKKSSDLLESAHDIWLAGLGSLAVAEQEGTKLFRQLIDRGRDFEARLGGPVEATRSSMKGAVRDIRDRAERTMKSVEASLDEQVKSALGRLGLPTREELAELRQRVEKLQRNLGGNASTKSRKRSSTPGVQTPATKPRKNKKK